MKPYLSSLLLSAGFSLLLVSCDSGTARKISSFDELPDPTADTLSDWERDWLNQLNATTEKEDSHGI